MCFGRSGFLGVWSLEFVFWYYPSAPTLASQSDFDTLALMLWLHNLPLMVLKRKPNLQCILRESSLDFNILRDHFKELHHRSSTINYKLHNTCDRFGLYSDHQASSKLSEWLCQDILC